jgi:hypothetical protein
MKPVKGKVIMHFLDEDHMWLDIDYLDRNYPTDVHFPRSDFQGAKIIYWRAEKIYDRK